MLSRLSIVRRSASGPLATQVLAVAKTNANPMRFSVVAASRCYQFSSTSSSPSLGDWFDSAYKMDLAQDSFFALHRPLLGSMEVRQGLVQEYQGSVDELSSYLSSLAPFTPPSSLSQDVLRNIESKQLSVPNMDGVSPFQQQTESVPLQSIMDDLEETNVMHMTSVLRKRKIKMRKHKYKKLRKRTRALRKKLGK
ncbi:unnamed protein product [Mortierella alpina]